MLRNAQHFMRPYRHPVASILIAAMFLLGAQPTSAADLKVHVKDDAGKPVADAVVYVSPRGGVAATAPLREPVVMDQRDKEFVPYVLPVQVGTSVQFPNSDNIRHHVYSFSQAKIFELALYKGTPAGPVTFDKPGAVALGCNIHDWMIGYVYVLETPYFEKTADNGEARLTALPVGTVEVRVWHPRLRDGVDKTLRPITLSAGSETRVEFSVRLNPDRRKQRPADYDPSQYDYN